MKVGIIAVVVLVSACSSNQPSDTTDGSVPADSQVTGDSTTGGGGLRVVMGTGGATGHLVDSAGNPVLLHGANRSGTEYSCLGSHIFDGPSDQASLDAMKSWHINVVRVPLNEDCWLGINGVPTATSGQTYRDAIRTYVSLLEQNDMIAILDLHWVAPGTDKANRQLGMADADHAPTFWTQVATAYAGDHASVIFDLFNEPFITDWGCWLEGGMCANNAENAAYAVAGMATLLKAVRATHADNVVIMGGLGYSGDFKQWVAKVNSIPQLAAPNDGLTLDNVMASWHAYSYQSVQTMCPTQYNGYSTALSCVDGMQTASNYGLTGVLASGFPVLIGEIGIGAYSTSIAPYTTTQAQQLVTWLNSTLTFMDGQQQGYLGWDWNTESPPLLISNYDGTATPYFGAAYKAHLAQL